MHIYFMFRQVCTIGPSFLNTISLMHRRLFCGRHLVYYSKNEIVFLGVLVSPSDKCLMTLFSFVGKMREFFWINSLLTISLCCRLYPLTIGSSRLLVKDVVLSGYQVPKGVSSTFGSLSALLIEVFFGKYSVSFISVFSGFYILILISTIVIQFLFLKMQCASFILHVIYCRCLRDVIKKKVFYGYINKLLCFIKMT